MLGDSRRDLLTSRTSNHEKHLENFFKICHMGFWRLALATCLRLTPVAKNLCYAQWGLFSRQFSKTFQFSLAYCDCSLSPFFKITMFTHNTFIFSLISLPIFKKSMGYVSFSMYFTSLALDFLDCVSLMISTNMIFEYGFLTFCWDCCVGFVGYVLFYTLP